MKKFVAVFCSFALLGSMCAPGAVANPTGPNTVAGSATITSNGPTMNINAADKTITNWQSFSIRGNEAVNINQPSTNAVYLSRVVGGNPSDIFGSLTANGHFFLENPTGIYFGPNSSVNVGAVVASTLHMTDSNFLNGVFQFDQTPGTAFLTGIVNRGTIKASQFAALVSPFIANEGTVWVDNSTQNGNLTLGASQHVTLDSNGLITAILPISGSPKPVMLTQNQDSPLLEGVVKLGVPAVNFVPGPDGTVTAVGAEGIAANYSAGPLTQGTSFGDLFIDARGLSAHLTMSSAQATILGQNGNVIMIDFNPQNGSKSININSFGNIVTTGFLPGCSLSIGCYTAAVDISNINPNILPGTINVSAGGSITGAFYGGPPHYDAGIVALNAMTGIGTSGSPIQTRSQSLGLVATGPGAGIYVQSLYSPSLSGLLVQVNNGNVMVSQPNGSTNFDSATGKLSSSINSLLSLAFFNTGGNLVINSVVLGGSGSSVGLTASGSITDSVSLTPSLTASRLALSAGNGINIFSANVDELDSTFNTIAGNVSFNNQKAFLLYGVQAPNSAARFSATTGNLTLKGIITAASADLSTYGGSLIEGCAFCSVNANDVSLYGYYGIGTSRNPIQIQTASHLSTTVQALGAGTYVADSVNPANVQFYTNNGPAYFSPVTSGGAPLLSFDANQLLTAGQGISNLFFYNGSGNITVGNFSLGLSARATVWAGGNIFGSPNGVAEVGTLDLAAYTIGTSAVPLSIRTGSLSAYSNSGSTFISDLLNVPLTLSSMLSTGGITLSNVGSINVGYISANGDVSLTSTNGGIFNGGIYANSVALTAAQGIGTQNSPLQTSVRTLTAAATMSNVGMYVNNSTGVNSTGLNNLSVTTLNGNVSVTDVFGQVMFNPTTSQLSVSDNALNMLNFSNRAGNITVSNSFQEPGSIVLSGNNITLNNIRLSAAGGLSLNAAQGISLAYTNVSTNGALSLYSPNGNLNINSATIHSGADTSFVAGNESVYSSNISTTGALSLYSPNGSIGINSSTLTAGIVAMASGNLTMTGSNMTSAGELSLSASSNSSINSSTLSSGGSTDLTAGNNVSLSSSRVFSGYGAGGVTWTYVYAGNAFNALSSQLYSYGSYSSFNARTSITMFGNTVYSNGANYINAPIVYHSGNYFYNPIFYNGSTVYGCWGCEFVW